VGSLSAKAGLGAGDTVTIGFTGQMHSLVLLDENHQPLRPAILWCDERSRPQTAEISRLIPNFQDITGNAPLPAFTLPQLLWVRDNEPDIFKRVSTALVPKDYLRYRATGALGTEWTDASATGMLDSQSRTWAENILSVLELDPALLPDLHAPHDVAGEVSGLLPPEVSTEASFGVGDQFAEALSAGLLQPGQRCIVLGTSAVLLGAENHAVPGAFCHAPKDRWLSLDSLHAGGMSLTWFRDTFAPQSSIDDLVAEAGIGAPAGSDGLIYLPFLAAERNGNGLGTPGAFVGARHEHRRAHFVRAILEGVAFELKRMSERQSPQTAQEITLKGGGAQSPLWRDIFSGVFQRPVRTSGKDASFGAAMTAGLAAGWWKSYQEVDLQTSLSTDPAKHLVEVYGERYAVYTDLISKISGPPAALAATVGEALKRGLQR
jgi:xylulokinase